MNERRWVRISLYVITPVFQSLFHFKRTHRRGRVIHQSFHCLANGKLILHFSLDHLCPLGILNIGRERPHKGLQSVDLKLSIVQILNSICKLPSRILQSRFQIIRGHLFTLLAHNDIQNNRSRQAKNNKDRPIESSWDEEAEHLQNELGLAEKPVSRLKSAVKWNQDWELHESD
jgi:hypothetical protein